MKKTLLFLLLPFYLSGQIEEISPEKIQHLLDSTNQLSWNNDYDACFDLITRLKIYLHNHPSPVHEAELLRHEGYVYADLGYLDKAQTVFQQSLNAAKKSNDKESIAFSYYALGYLAQEKLISKAAPAPSGEDKLAYFYAAKIWEELKDTMQLIDTYDAQGYLYFLQGDLINAIEFGKKAVRLVESVNYTDSAPNIYSNLAEYHIVLSNYQDAEKYLSKAVRWMECYPGELHEEYRFNIRRNLGEVYLHTGRREEGLKLITDANRYAKENKNTYILKETSIQLIRDALAHDDFERAFFTQTDYMERREDFHQSELALYHDRNQTLLNIGLREKEYQLLAEKLNSQQKLNYYTWGVLVSLLALAASLFFLYRQNKRFNSNLKKEVEKQTSQLRRSNEALERFAYIASHDLRTPLRNVISFIGLIQRRLKIHNDTSLLEFIAYARNYANHMNRLLNDILDYSKIGSHHKSEVEPVDMNEAADMTLALIKERIETTGAKVEIKPLPTVMGNMTRIVQLLQNLIENALTYNDKPVPAILIQSEGLDKSKAIISVQDNGIGIEPAYHNKIFEMFTRLHNIEQYPGTGLGLSICKRIVEESGGNIWLESVAGEGTAIYFSLPLAEREYSPQKKPSVLSTGEFAVAYS